MSDINNIYKLYMENAAQHKQPKMTVDNNGNKFWYLHRKLHRIDAPAIEWANGDKTWWLMAKDIVMVRQPLN